MYICPPRPFLSFSAMIARGSDVPVPIVEPERMISFPCTTIVRFVSNSDKYHGDELLHVKYPVCTVQGISVYSNNGIFVVSIAPRVFKARFFRIRLIVSAKIEPTVGCCMYDHMRFVIPMFCPPSIFPTTSTVWVEATFVAAVQPDHPQSTVSEGVFPV